MVMNYRIVNIATNRLMIMISLSFIICHLSLCPIDAQTTFTQRLQQQGKGEGKVTVVQDKQIDTLVNGPQTPPKEEKKDEKKDEKPDSKRPDATQQDTTPADTTVMTRPHTGRTYKTSGYRIQVFAGSNTRRDRQRAEQIKSQLKNLFPNEAVYVHFYSPRWICRIGNYRNYEDALRMKNEIKQMGFESATIVKTQITAYY